MRILVALLAVGLALAEKIQYRPVPKEVLKQRLELAAKDNASRLRTLELLFEHTGCKGPNLQPLPVKGSKLPNLACTLPGESPNTILVGAHYDKVRAGMGVVDNWSGASMLANLHEALSSVPRKHTLVFIGFTDEEKGLAGSRYFVAKQKKEDLARIKAAINIDSIGMGTANVWSKRSDSRLLALLEVLNGALKFDVPWINVDKVGDSDSHPFAGKKIPVIDFHSLTTETLPALHTPRDTIDAISLDHYEVTHRMLSAYLALLDLRLEVTLATPVQYENK